MNSANRSFFRRRYECRMNNFSKETVKSINKMKFKVDVKPFSEKLEFKFCVRQKRINGTTVNDLGVMIHTNILRPVRTSMLFAKFFVVLSDGSMHFCSEANITHLNDELTKQHWLLIIKCDDIFADMNRFLSNESLKVHIELEVLNNVTPLKATKHPTLNNYESLVNNPQFSDFKITCSDGKIIHAHKVILMAFGNDGTENAKPSQFFRSMIESQMNESQSGEMNVADIDSTTMLELMRFIYAAKVNGLQRKAGKLLIVADKYDIVELKKVCVEVLENQLSEDNVVELLKITYILSLEKLKENCIDLIKFKIKSVSKRDDYKELSSEILRDIIDSMTIEPTKHEFAFKLQKPNSLQYDVDSLVHRPLPGIIDQNNELRALMEGYGLF